MVLKQLTLTNFRNLPKVDLELAPVTLLLGKNAQGKSNILESVYFLATTKSPRAERDIQLIKEGEEFCRVEGEVFDDGRSTMEGRILKMEDGDIENINLQSSTLKKPSSTVHHLSSINLTKLEIFMQRREGVEGVEKRVKVNGVAKRVMDYIGNLAAIHFAPEDLNLVTGSPALRRWHIDLTLAQVDRQYKRVLTEYHQALVARNRILKNIKEGMAKLSELDFWTNSIVESGQVVTEKRRNFFKSLNEEVSPLGDLGQFRFTYQESEISAFRIKEYLSREVAAATSLIGPHRDDFIFKLEGRDLAYFGSRGQQRTAVLELKLAELRFIQKTEGVRSVLLLDDVFSELDEAHREYIVEVVAGEQVILSAVEKSQVPDKLLKSAKIIRVEKGEISPLT